MKQLLIKPEKCIGCRNCELVYSFGHYGQFNPKLANVKVFEYEQAAAAIPIMCLQCEDPSCLKVCPVHAIRRDENGAVVMNPDKCIGCKMRLNACPLGNISYHPAVGRVFKCDLCGGEPRCGALGPDNKLIFMTGTMATSSGRYNAVAKSPSRAPPARPTPAGTSAPN